MGLEPRRGKCTGGSVADSVEALIGAIFLTTDNLHDVLSFIDHIKLVPLTQINQLTPFIQFKECSFENLKLFNLQKLPFTK